MSFVFVLLLFYFRSPCLLYHLCYYCRFFFLLMTCIYLLLSSPTCVHWSGTFMHMGSLGISSLFPSHFPISVMGGFENFWSPGMFYWAVFICSWCLLWGTPGWNSFHDHRMFIRVICFLIPWYCLPFLCRCLVRMKPENPKRINSSFLFFISNLFHSKSTERSFPRRWGRCSASCTNVLLALLWGLK